MSKIEKAAHILAAMVRIQPRIAHFTDLTPEKCAAWHLMSDRYYIQQMGGKRVCAV